MSPPHGGTLLSHPQHAFKYQMRSEISLNFSVNSEIFNSSPPFISFPTLSVMIIEDAMMIANTMNIIPIFS